MAAKLVKTEARGIYRRHAKDCDRVGRCACPYVVVYRGKTRTFLRLVEARAGKAAMGRGAKPRRFLRLVEAREGKAAREREGKRTRGHAAGLHRDEPRDGCPDCERELVAREQVDTFFHVYALEWVERYQGTGRRGYREETRDEDRRLLKRYALKFFPPALRVDHRGPRLVSEFIDWLVKQPSQRGGTLSDKSVKNALQHVSSCLATARREDLIEHNPCDDAVLPHRPRIEEDEEAPRPFPRLELEDADGEIEIIESMELVVSLINPKHRPMFELLAATGVRRAELIAFKVHDLSLNGEEPYVKIRRRIRRRRGTGLVVGALKSRYAKRDLPVPIEVADRLRAHIAGRSRNAWVFASATGAPLDPNNLANRVLAPACEEAAVEWAGFHAFRHTVASRLFAEGRNILQVQRWLGHHSP